MKRMVKDVMSRDVIVVASSAPYRELIMLMRSNDVSALPVADAEGALIGIVSEADLLLKEEHDPHEKRHVFESRLDRAERERAAGIVAGQLMSSPVITVSPDASIAEAARELHRHGIKRAPVVDADGEIVGIISRRDLLKVFLRSDAEIRDEIVHEIIERKLWVTPQEGEISVDVVEGMVTLTGWTDRTSLAEILAAMAAGVEGVVRVDNLLSSKVDDSRWRPVVPEPNGVAPYALRR